MIVDVHTLNLNTIRQSMNQQTSYPIIVCNVVFVPPCCIPRICFPIVANADDIFVVVEIIFPFSPFRKISATFRSIIPIVKTISCRKMLSCQSVVVVGARFIEKIFLCRLRSQYSFDFTCEKRK